MVERFIYELLDAGGVIFYVGKTNYPDYRLKVHRERFGQDITMNILERLSADDNWRDRERFWIEQRLSQGFSLANRFIGATGPGSMDEATKQKLHLALKGRPRPQGSGLKKGFRHSEESNQKNAEAHRGLIPWNRGLPTNGDNPMLGKHHSEESRAKMRAAIPWTPERRRAQAERARQQGLQRGSIQRKVA